MTKTEFVEQMDEALEQKGVGQLVLENMKLQETENFEAYWAYCSHQFSTNLPVYISAGFYWAKTEQGFDYWKNIYSELKRSLSNG